MHCVKETAFPQQLEPLLGKAGGGWAAGAAGEEDACCCVGLGLPAATTFSGQKDFALLSLWEGVHWQKLLF